MVDADIAGIIDGDSGYENNIRLDFCKMGRGMTNDAQ